MIIEKSRYSTARRIETRPPLLQKSTKNGRTCETYTINLQEENTERGNFMPFIWAKTFWVRPQKYREQKQNDEWKFFFKARPHMD